MSEKGATSYINNISFLTIFYSRIVIKFTNEIILKQLFTSLVSVIIPVKIVIKFTNEIILKQLFASLSW